MANTNSLDPMLSNLDGSISMEIVRTTNTQFELIYNSLTGWIPSDVGLMTRLSPVPLHENSFSVSLPSDLGGVASLITLWLFDNSDQCHSQ
jgi:hypothetical protein